MHDSDDSTKHIFRDGDQECFECSECSVTILKLSNFRLSPAEKHVDEKNHDQNSQVSGISSFLFPETASTCDMQF